MTSRAPMTWAEWEADVLRSADADGVVSGWKTASYLEKISHLMGMQLRGLLDRQNGIGGGPWIITDKGRAERLRLMAADHDTFLVSSHPEGLLP